ncbi:hypothetical protein GF312_17955 [Candidatus Poribacteria bacterium]|nr:hypothetical protein [Candidatus Poribacteria bacterium]
MNKLIIPFVLITIIAIFIGNNALSSEISEQIYSVGTKFTLDASFWGLSVSGNMEVSEKTTLNDKDAILIRSKVTKFGGLMGFIARFLRTYKGSDTFDSYIDAKTKRTMRYQVYKSNDDGTKDVKEHVYFNRKENKVISLKDDKVIIKNAKPDLQELFGSFLELICKMNEKGLALGQRFYVNLYEHERASQIEIKVKDYMIINGIPSYIVFIDDIPNMFKYPAQLEAQIIKNSKGFWIPVRGKCIIKIRFFPDVTVKGRLSQERFGN